MSRTARSVAKLPLPSLWTRLTNTHHKITEEVELKVLIDVLDTVIRRKKADDDIVAVYVSIDRHPSIWLVNCDFALKIMSSDSGFNVVHKLFFNEFIHLLKVLDKYVLKLNRPICPVRFGQGFVDLSDLPDINVLKPFFNTPTVNIERVIMTLKKMPTMNMRKVLWEGRLVSPQLDVINEDELQHMVRKPLKSNGLLTYYDYINSERAKLEGLDTPIPQNTHPRVPLPTQDRLHKVQRDSGLYYTQLTLKNAVEREKKLRNNLIPTSTKVPKRRAPAEPQKQRRRRQAPATKRPAWR